MLNRSESNLQVILVGDRHQLHPATLSVGLAAKFSEVSLLENLQTKGSVQGALLTETHHMHPCFHPPIIIYMYGGILTTPISPNDQSLLHDRFPFPKRDFPYLFCAEYGPEQMPLGYSRSNQGEIMLMKKMAFFLKEVVGLEWHQMAFLMFYQAQKLETETEFHSESWDTVTSDGLSVVSTVDAFQGQERECIVLSCVCSWVRENQEWSEMDRGDICDPQAPLHIGFLGKPNRANVAVTRARHGLINWKSKSAEYKPILGTSDSLL